MTDDAADKMQYKKGLNTVPGEAICNPLRRRHKQTDITLLKRYFPPFNTDKTCISLRQPFLEDVIHSPRPLKRPDDQRCGR